MEEPSVTNPSAVPQAQDGDTTATPEDLRLALRAATLYYLDGLTQAQVADRLGVSRATAGRLVARARSHGLVRIEVMPPPHLRDDLHADIERALEDRFGLTEAVVVGARVDDRGPVDNSASFTALGRAAASLLTRRLEPSDTLGFTWGPETIAVAQAIPTGIATCATIVQLDGSVTTSTYQTGTEYVLGRCAEQLRAQPVRLPTPLYADATTVASMRTDSVISRTLELGAGADVMMFGVGAVSSSTTLFEGSFLDTAMLGTLDELGAVGEIGGRFFREDGTPAHLELETRTMSTPLSDIAACPATILVAGGASKHRAVHGALRGGYARMLVCDIDCAQWLLDQSPTQPHDSDRTPPK
ncbi:sugar-binding transcriptional regulator [Rhodococcus sp. NPDC060086]|uniref:sugar-binding transcriptional regulator n=1 Tax=Rhodococcus sp. NPDC060086 TaxID=3347055 RepID=UPI00364933D1